MAEEAQAGLGRQPLRAHRGPAEELRLPAHRPIGRGRIDAVSTRDLVAVIENVRAVDTAHRVSQILAQVFRFAKQTGYIHTAVIGMAGGTGKRRR